MMLFLIVTLKCVDSVFKKIINSKFDDKIKIFVWKRDSRLLDLSNSLDPRDTEVVVEEMEVVVEGSRDHQEDMGEEEG